MTCECVHETAGGRAACERLEVGGQADGAVERDAETEHRHETADEVDDDRAVPDGRPVHGRRLAAQPIHQRRPHPALPTARRL